MLKYDQNPKKNLFQAAKNGDIEEIEKTLKQGITVKEKNKRDIWNFPFEYIRIGQTALLYAAENGQTQTVNWLLKHGASLEEKDDLGRTPLIYAALGEHLQVMSLLLEHGASLEEKDKSGQTALLCSILRGRTQSIDWLLEHGASLTEKDFYGKTVLMHAADYNLLNSENLKWMLNKASKSLSDKKNNTAINIIDAVNDEGNTLLHYAVRKQFEQLVLCLTTLNAKWDIANKSNRTSWDLAKNNPKLLNTLIFKKVDLPSLDFTSEQFKAIFAAGPLPLEVKQNLLEKLEKDSPPYVVVNDAIFDHICQEQLQHQEQDQYASVHQQRLHGKLVSFTRENVLNTILAKLQAQIQILVMEHKSIDKLNQLLENCKEPALFINIPNNLKLSGWFAKPRQEILKKLDDHIDYLKQVSQSYEKQAAYNKACEILQELSRYYVSYCQKILDLLEDKIFDGKKLKHFIDSGSISSDYLVYDILSSLRIDYDYNPFYYINYRQEILDALERRKPFYSQEILDVLEYKTLSEAEKLKHLQILSLPPYTFSTLGLNQAYLNPDAVSQLAPAPGETEVRRSLMPHGTHVVRHYNGVHFKYNDVSNPCYPGVEFMVSSLYNILADASYGIAPTELVKLKGKNFSQILIASRTVEGLTLQDLFDKYISYHLEYLQYFDHYSFSAMVITSLLSNPDDGKPTNYIVPFIKDINNNTQEVFQIRIIGIDNDMAFANPVVKKCLVENEKYYVDVRSIFYFFPQMQETLHPELRKQLLKRPAEFLILDWLKKLHMQNEYYLKLKENGIFTEQEWQSLQLPLYFPQADTVTFIYQQLRKIQEALQHNSELTHQALFELLYPSLAYFYRKIAEKRGCQKGEDILECYDDLHSFQLSSEDIEFIQKNQDYDLIKEKDDFLERPFTLSDNITDFLASIDYIHYFSSIEIQLFFLGQIKELKCLEYLTLRLCSISDTLLLELVSALPKLKNLTLIDCRNISAVGIEAVLQQNQKQRSFKLAILCCNQITADHIKELAKQGLNIEFSESIKENLNQHSNKSIIKKTSRPEQLSRLCIKQPSEQSRAQSTFVLFNPSSSSSFQSEENIR